MMTTTMATARWATARRDMTPTAMVTGDDSDNDDGDGVTVDKVYDDGDGTTCDDDDDDYDDDSDDSGDGATKG